MFGLPGGEDHVDRTAVLRERQAQALHPHEARRCDHEATHQEHRLDSFYDGPMWTGWGWYGPWAWGPPMGYRTQVTTYTVGTLVVDMFDTSTKRAVWSAVAEDTVPNTPAKINADIDAAVARMFLDFPPGKAPPGY